VVVDRLSRLGPESTSSKELPIDDSFSDEQLCQLYPNKLLHGMLIWLTSKWVMCYLQDYPTNKRRSSSRMPNTMCGKTLFFISCAEMGFTKDAFLKKRAIMSYTTAMPQPIVVTLDQIKPLRKYSK